jgi:hypothetical protein
MKYTRTHTDHSPPVTARPPPTTGPIRRLPVVYPASKITSLPSTSILFISIKAPAKYKDLPLVYTGMLI